MVLLLVSNGYCPATLYSWVRRERRFLFHYYTFHLSLYSSDFLLPRLVLVHPCFQVNTFLFDP
jgi:hypothetical protein